MEMIKIPHTDLEVPRLALGCMGLGGGWEADVQLTKDHERQARGGGRPCLCEVRHAFQVHRPMRVPCSRRCPLPRA